MSQRGSGSRLRWFRLGTACPKPRGKSMRCNQGTERVPIWPKLRALRKGETGLDPIECRPHEGVLCLSLGWWEAVNAARIGEI